LEVRLVPRIEQEWCAPTRRRRSPECPTLRVRPELESLRTIVLTAAVSMVNGFTVVQMLSISVHQHRPLINGSVTEINTKGRPGAGAYAALCQPAFRRKVCQQPPVLTRFAMASVVLRLPEGDVDGFAVGMDGRVQPDTDGCRVRRQPVRTR
jgi:hypothetical protein